MLKQFIDDFSISAAFAGIVTFIIGISVSAVLIIEGAQHLGASPDQVSSWFLALGISIGLSGAILSWKYKYPVATAWSTPGIALIIASSQHYSLAEATGAFIACGVLIAITGFSGIFQKLLAKIPLSLSCAMLAGILLKFGINLFIHLPDQWFFTVGTLLSYFILKRVLPRYSIVFMVCIAFILSMIFCHFSFTAFSFQLTKPIWVTPSFSWQGIIGLAIPLFIVNLSSQFLPGIGMIKSYGYTPHTNQLVGWIGITQTCFAPFGAFSVCLAAISAAVSLDNQVHPDPKKRYIAGICCGLCYIFMGVFALYLTHLLLNLPQLFITTVAGIALLGTISHNIAVAFEDTESRDASLFTFLLSASGIQILGIGSAFWGLLLGILLYKFLSKK